MSLVLWDSGSGDETEDFPMFLGNIPILRPAFRFLWVSASIVVSDMPSCEAIWRSLELVWSPLTGDLSTRPLCALRVPIHQSNCGERLSVIINTLRRKLKASPNKQTQGSRF